MAKYQLDFSEFGYMDIEATIRLLQLYLIEKNEKGNKDLWLNKIIYDNSEPDVYLIDDNGKQYHEESNKIVEIDQ